MTIGDRPTGRTQTSSTECGVPPASVVLGVATDDVEVQGPALALALHEARRRGAQLVVLHGCGSGRRLSPETSWADEKVVEHGRRLVGRVAHELRQMGPVEAKVIGVASPLPAVDALLAASQSASMLLLHDDPPRHPLLTPATVREVAARSECPVLVQRGDESGLGRHRIVVGVDEHGRSQAALHVAMDEAVASGEPVTAVHVWDVPGTVEVPPTLGELQFAHEEACRRLAEAVAGLREDYPTVELEREVVRGWPADVLATTSRTARLLVVARHTSSRVGFHALGRTARSLLHHAQCPVLLTPPRIAPRPVRDRFLRDVPIGPGF